MTMRIMPTITHTAMTTRMAATITAMIMATIPVTDMTMGLALDTLMCTPLPALAGLSPSGSY
ncbi:hypothetical protein Gbfr_001_106 [Gluconobacter frateurii M-2]|nr:hypothetical protein Gbfr_001_106 [Gluconobacter frateurii M-2]